jgi:hypothetical protein
MSSNNQVKFNTVMEISGPLILSKNLTEFPENPAAGTFIIKNGLPYIFTSPDFDQNTGRWIPLCSHDSESSALERLMLNFREFLTGYLQANHRHHS